MIERSANEMRMNSSIFAEDSNQPQALGYCNLPASFSWSRVDTGELSSQWPQKARWRWIMDVGPKQLGVRDCNSKMLFLHQDTLSHWYRTFDFKRVRIPLTKEVFSDAVTKGHEAPIHFLEGTRNTHSNYWLHSLGLAMTEQAWVFEALLSCHSIILGEGMMTSCMEEEWHRSWRRNDIIHWDDSLLTQGREGNLRQ